MRHATTTLFALLPIVACAAQAPTATPTSTAAISTPVFDCFHINSAWGFSMSGRFIDSDGTIYSYQRKAPAWMPHEIVESDSRFLRDEDLQSKYAGREKVGNVSAHELELHRASIEAAGKGKLVQAGPTANDAGSSSCHAYVRDAGKNRYRDVNLGTDGGISDMPMRNDSTQAQELIAWLKTVGVSK